MKPRISNAPRDLDDDLRIGPWRRQRGNMEKPEIEEPEAEKPHGEKNPLLRKREVCKRLRIADCEMRIEKRKKGFDYGLRIADCEMRIEKRKKGFEFLDLQFRNSHSEIRNRVIFSLLP